MLCLPARFSARMLECLTPTVLKL
ncbi:unnamed protein product [Oikopleura dioica]|uniref:Uncharacterized protein n=1 Tax=Oikopleura dioica TaxID=34765 RepID=E4YWQ8_OIKDI|nr:unnamed protein product [Oikopleura dioica]